MSMHGDAPHDRERVPPADPDYQVPCLTRRTAANQAACFLPYLRPGMDLLDGGCGPGTIMLGLADAVRPGQVVGIDVHTGHLDRARAAVAERSITNARFEQANIHALPFEAGSFDAAWVHAVLEHLPDPVAALREVHHVLRPGGLIGVRRQEIGALLVAPPDSVLDQIAALYRRQRAQVGINARIGRSLRAVLRAAGFERVVVSASVDARGTPEATREFGEDATRAVTGSPWARDWLAFGWVDSTGIERLTEALRAWGEDPDAFVTVTWCEAIAWAA